MAQSDPNVPLCILCPICQGTMELVYDRPSQSVRLHRLSFRDHHPRFGLGRPEDEA